MLTLFILLRFMYGIFQKIRKRTAKRRFVAFWLCLVAIELFCPVLCGEQIYAAEFQTEVNTFAEESSGRSKLALSNFDLQEAKDESAGCNDECLCHATPLPSIAFGMKSGSVCREGLSSHFAGAIFSSLPPPYLPPKFS